VLQNNRRFDKRKGNAMKE